MPPCEHVGSVHAYVCMSAWAPCMPPCVFVSMWALCASTCVYVSMWTLCAPCVNTCAHACEHMHMCMPVCVHMGSPPWCSLRVSGQGGCKRAGPAIQPAKRRASLAPPGVTKVDRRPSIQAAFRCSVCPPAKQRDHQASHPMSRADSGGQRDRAGLPGIITTGSPWLRGSVRKHGV